MEIFWGLHSPRITLYNTCGRQSGITIDKEKSISFYFHFFLEHWGSTIKEIMSFNELSRTQKSPWAFLFVNFLFPYPCNVFSTEWIDINHIKAPTLFHCGRSFFLFFLLTQWQYFALWSWGCAPDGWYKFRNDNEMTAHQQENSFGKALSCSFSGLLVGNFSPENLFMLKCIYLTRADY